jgi:transposase
MVPVVENLPDDVTSLRDIILSLNTSYTEKEDHYKEHISLLEEQVRFLKAKLFGRKSEKHTEDNRQQLQLFNEAEETLEVSAPKTADDVTVPAHTRKKPGRRPLPESLPRTEVIHDLSDEEKVCGCGTQMSHIGEDISEKLDIIPAKMQVIRHIRYKYACKGCEGVDSDTGSVKTAPLPPQLIPQGIATPGLIAYVIVSKFVDALPFYRQEKIFERIEVDITRATMAGWAIYVANRLRPLMELLHLEIRSGPLINIDETKVQVLSEPGRDNTSLSYMWVFRGGEPERPTLIYKYHPTRSGDIPQEYLNGYKGYIQTDGYTGYDALGQKPEITHVGCWAHARRRFVAAVSARERSKRKGKGKKGYCDVALDYIRRLYVIEKRAGGQNFTIEKRYRIRQEEAKPILKEFKTWLDNMVGKVPPKSLSGKAIDYTMSQWEKLEKYIEDGLLPIDNNIVENAIRPFVVGRKNWLFAGHPRGADAGAIIYSLIETAKANNLEPYRYLRYLFEKLPLAQIVEDYKSLLPQYVDRNEFVISV